MSTTIAGAPGADAHVRLAHFPVAFFSTVMGLAGLAIALLKASHVLGLAAVIPTAVAAFAALVFLTTAIFYAFKAGRHWHAVTEEFNHPVKINFFPTISISLILFSILALELAPALAGPLLAIGASLHLAFTLAVLNWWFNKQHYETAHLNPAWFIPIVGNVLVPVSAVRLGHVEAAWFFFSIGIVFWGVLFTIIINRVVFHHPLPERLRPTLFIMIAPPAVGFLSWVALSGGIDGFGRVLFYFGLFITLFLATQALHLARIRFFLSWWAYSFPLAAITVAAWTMYERLGGAVFLGLSLVLQTIVIAVVVGLAARTMVAIVRGEVCVPE